MSTGDYVQEIGHSTFKQMAQSSPYGRKKTETSHTPQIEFLHLALETHSAGVRSSRALISLYGVSRKSKTNLDFPAQHKPAVSPSWKKKRDN